MFEIDPNQPRGWRICLAKRHKRMTQQISFRLITLFLLSILFFMPLVFLSVAPAQAGTSGPDVDPSINAPLLSDQQVEQALLNYGSDRAIQAQQAASTTLEVQIVSSPWATLDNNNINDGPKVFVVQAVVTNTGSNDATDLVVTLDYDDAANGWVLVGDEDPERRLDSLAPGEAYNAYWFATYPTTADESHQYTVTAEASNADSVETSDNFYDDNLLPPNSTVQTRESNSTGSSGVAQTSSNVQVGVSFAMTVTYNLGTNPDATIFSPAGNLSFEPGVYRLLASKVNIFTLDNNDNRTGQIVDATDRLYFPTLPDVPSTDFEAEVIYTFIALTPANTQLCSYAVVEGGGGSPSKYDQFFCGGGTTVPITGSISISMTKQVNVTTIEQGQQLDYTITYTNNGTEDVEYVWIWDDIPANLGSILSPTIFPASDPSETTDSRVAWNIDTLPKAGQPGSSDTLSFSVLVDGDGQDIPDGTDLVNQAFLGISISGLPNRTALSDTTTTTIQAPTISVSKTDNQTTAEPGDLLTYVVQVDNTGSVAATGLVITDVLPDGVILNGQATPPTSTQVGQTLVWDNLADVASNGTLNLTIPVTVDPDLSQETTLTNDVSVSYQNAGAHIFATETASDTTDVTIPETTLTFNKTALDVNGPPLVVSDTIRYTLLVTNTGDAFAYNVTVTDDLPDQVTCTSVSGDSAPAGCADPLTWTIPTLAAGTTASLDIDVTVNPGTEGQNITNSASVTASNVVSPPPNPEVCPDGSLPVGDACPTSTPVPTTTVTLSKTAVDVNEAPLQIGDTISYTLEVNNTGSDTAYNVTVTDDLPDQVTCTSVSGDSAPAGCADPLTWTIPTLAAGTSASLVIAVTLDPESAGQAITNSASVTASNVVSPPPDPEVCPDGSLPVGNDCSSTPIAPNTTLTFNKTAVDVNGSPLVVGDTIRYTLQVTNTGSSPGVNVTVTDDLPDQVTCTSVSGDSAPAGCADPLTWTIPNLAAGTTASLNIDVTVNPGTEGQAITNTASVTASNVVSPPPNPEVCPDGSLPVGGDCPTSTPVPTTTVTLSKTAVDVNEAPLQVGDTISYTLEVNNTGSSTAYNVTVTDDLPDQVTCTSVSGDSAPAGCADPLTWTIPTLAAGTSASLVIAVTLDPDSEGQSIVNSASIDGSNVVSVVPDPEVCPDGSLPNAQGNCTNNPEPAPGPEDIIIYLPVILRD